MAIVWFIDDVPDEARVYGQRLQSILGTDLEVKPIAPLPSKEEYLSLLHETDTACIVIDQRLFASGDVAYTGIGLAQYLRSVNTKVPIYILTNWSNDTDAFAGGEWSVEDIIDKENLSKRDRERQREILSARILRNIDTYQDVLTKRASRFNELLKKSLSEDLSEDEITELNNLQAARTSAVAADELRQLSDLEKLIRQTNRLLKGLDNEADSVDDNGIEP